MCFIYFFLLFGDNSPWTKNGIIDLNHLNAKIAMILSIKNFNEKVIDHFAASKTRCIELI